jgi:hypothetical protein
MERELLIILSKYGYFSYSYCTALIHSRENYHSRKCILNNYKLFDTWVRIISKHAAGILLHHFMTVALLLSRNGEFHKSPIKFFESTKKWSYIVLRYFIQVLTITNGRLRIAVRLEKSVNLPLWYSVE